jgi:hypothetical protein
MFSINLVKVKKFNWHTSHNDKAGMSMFILFWQNLLHDMWKVILNKVVQYIKVQ